MATGRAGSRSATGERTPDGAAARDAVGPVSGRRGRWQAGRWLRGWRADGLLALLLLALALAFFAPLLRGQTFSAVAITQATIEPWHEQGRPLPRQYPQSDQADTFYPWIVFAGNSLRAGELPLWDPYTFGGHPFFANGETNLLYPPRLILTRLLPASWAQDLFLLLHVWCSGLSMAFFLRRLGVGRVAALLGATVWMFNSFTLGWLLLGHIAALTALLPLALALAREAARTHAPRHAAWLGATLGLMLLGSNILMTLVAWLTVGLYYGALLAREAARSWRAGRSAGGWRRELATLLGPPALAALVALGIGAAQLLPTIELAGQMARVSADYGRHVGLWRVQPAELRAILAPELMATDRTLNYRLWFVGWVPLLLAPFALRRWGGRWWLLVAGGLALYVLGTPLTRLGTQLVPGLAYFRPLGRMLFVWALAWAIVAALGYDGFGRWLGARRPGWRRALPALGLALVALTAAQLIGYGRAINPPFQQRTAAALYPPTPLIERLIAAGPEARIVPLRTINGPEEWAPPMFVGSIPQGLGLRITGGYESLLPAREADFWRVVKGEELADVLANPVEDAVVLNFYPRRVRYDLLPLIGVNLIAAVPDVTPQWLAQRWPGLLVEPIYEGPDGWIYRLPDARPVAYLSYHVEATPDERAALAATTARQQPPDRADLLLATETTAADGLPTGGTCGGVSRARQVVAAQTANTVTLRTASACAGLLVLNHSWAPGWTATVDGRETPVLRANYLARAVAVPAGEHAVRLVYAPRSFFAGLGVTSATASGLLLAAAVGWRRKHDDRRIPLTAHVA